MIIMRLIMTLNSLTNKNNFLLNLYKMACNCKNKRNNSAPKMQVRKTTIATNGKVASASNKIMRRDIK